MMEPGLLEPDFTYRGDGFLLASSSVIEPWAQIFTQNRDGATWTHFALRALQIIEGTSDATQQTLLIIYVGEGEGDEKKVVSHSGINLHSEKLRRYLLLEITYHQLETNPLATCLSTPQTLEFMADPYTHGIHYQEIFPTTEETIYSSDLESTEWCHMVTNGKHCISSRLLRCWLVTQLFSQRAN